MSRLVLVRHGRTAWNADGRWQGQTDVPLDDSGRRQAAAMAAAVAARYEIAQVWSSDLARAAETAGLVAAATGLEVRTDRGLREIFTGDWEGRLASEIEQAWPGEYHRWIAGEDFVRSGGAETRAQVAERTAAALERIAAQTPVDATTLVVGHGASLRAGSARLVGLPLEHLGVLGSLRNCAWVEVTDAASASASLAFGRTSGWVIEGWNLAAPGEPPPAAAGVRPAATEASPA